MFSEVPQLFDSSRDHLSVGAACTPSPGQVLLLGCPQPNPGEHVPHPSGAESTTVTRNCLSMKPNRGQRNNERLCSPFIFADYNSVLEKWLQVCYQRCENDLCPLPACPPPLCLALPASPPPWSLSDNRLSWPCPQRFHRVFSFIPTLLVAGGRPVSLGAGSDLTPVAAPQHQL